MAELDALNAEADGIKVELREVGHELTAIAVTEAELGQSREPGARRAYLRGRITGYLETVRDPDDTAALVRQVEELRARVRDLEGLADLEEQRQRVASMLQFVSAYVTETAWRLELEHSEHNSVRLDPERLTVIADTPTGPIELARMGSQRNFVGYHLVAHLALHRWFIEHDRPVPRFVFVDQPTQPFYPDDVRSASDEALADDDDIRVEQLFALLRDVAEQLCDLQIIVPGHANRPEAWFQERVVENWRHGKALVPQEWL